MGELEISVRQDLSRVDTAFNRLIADNELWKRFLRDPNGTLIDIGLHAPTSTDVNRRCNAIMFANLSNRELLRLTAESAESFFASLRRNEEAVEWEQHYREGLKEGEVRNLVDYDMAFIRHLHGNPELLKRRYRLAFEDVNRRHLLVRNYKESELHAYIDQCIEASMNFEDDITWPVLEEWDAHYGVGLSFGFAAVAEAAFDFTAFVGVEFAFAITAIGVIAFADQVDSSTPFLETEQHRHAAVLGELLKMSSELSVAAGLHVKQ